MLNSNGQSGRGIVTPKIGNIRIDNIRFHNFGSGTKSIETCSGCNSPTAFSNTGMEIYISNITYSNVTGYKLFMNGVKKEVLYDLDGSFTTTDFDGIQRISAAITNNWSHMRGDPACRVTTNPQWHNTLACD